MKPMKHLGTSILFLALACIALSVNAVAQDSDQMGAYVPAPRNHHGQMQDDDQDTDVQEQQPPSVQVRQQPVPAPIQPQIMASSNAVPPSLLDKPARPAKIDLAQGQLSIHADNSSLIDIMHRLTADAGMAVDGLNKDQRVFGTYGPGDPQEIISELLDGTGYNVVMLGRTDAGTPKQVTLTPRLGGGVPKGPAPMRSQPIPQDDDADDESQQSQPMIANPVVESPQQLAPGPGANGVRTPQQMMQELQQMRQQQMQQMQEQQGQQQPIPQQPPQ